MRRIQPAISWLSAWWSAASRNHRSALLGQQPGGALQAAQAARASAPDADATHAKLPRSASVSSLGRPISTLTGLGPPPHHGANLLVRADAGGVQAVGASLGVGLQAGDGVVQVRAADESSRRARSTARPGRWRRWRRGRRACARLPGRTRTAAWRRCRSSPRSTRRRCPCPRPRARGAPRLRIVGKALFEVGVDRQPGGRDHVAQMLQHLRERHAAVRQTAGPGSARAGGRQRLEAQVRQVAGRTHPTGWG